MKVHRFYVGSDIVLKHDFWLHDENLLRQWNKVLRFRSGEKVVLFDGKGNDKLYTIMELSNSEAHVQHVTDFQPKLPKQDVYLLWALLKKDKNDWVLQKCTELGISHFVPLLTDRTEKTGFDVERAKRIVVEASEQCGRSDIPHVRQALQLETAISEIAPIAELYICEQDGADGLGDNQNEKSLGVLIGPEGGWSDREKELFQSQKIKHLNLHDFTLRAETAAVAASAKLVQ